MDQTSSLDQDDAENSAAADVKTEAGGETSDRHVDPHCAADSQLLTEDSDTEDSGDYGTEAAGPWRPEVTGETEGQSSTPGSKVESSTDHKLSHQIPPVFTCKVCSESFQRRTYLFTHTSAHLRDCGVCGKHLEHSDSLKLHLRVHREMLFRCIVCCQTLTLQGNLRTHTGERPYWCPVCNRHFSQMSCFSRHPCQRRGLTSDP